MKRKLAEISAKLLSPSSRKITRVAATQRMWISASETRNYALGDPVCDYLKQLKLRASTKEFDYSSIIMKQGNIFEKNIVTKLKELFTTDELFIFDEDTYKRSREKDAFENTITQLKQKRPVIYNAVLHDEEEHLFGIPDLIVRNDYLSKIFSSQPKNIWSKLPKNKYSIVDVKFSTLTLKGNGLHITNASSVLAYKTQLYLYTSMLGKVQGWTPSCAYILGRNIKFSKKKENFTFSSFERCGVIDYSGYDSSVVELADGAVKWLRDVKENFRSWDISKDVLPRKELYPNMCNVLDGYYHPLKESLSRRLGEITEVWMCGVKARESAHSHGVYSWKDERCNTTTLGFKKQTPTTVLIDDILNTNRVLTTSVVINNTPRLKEMITEIKSVVIAGSNCDGVNFTREESQLYFIDFEFTVDVLANSPKSDIVFMIGIAYFEEGKLQYKSFSVKELNELEEQIMCTSFENFISSRGDISSAKFLHWSHAEDTKWNKIQHRVNLKFVDMCKIFKESRISVRGCLNFKLKNIASAMHSHGLIKTKWDTEITDGLSAALKLYDTDTNFSNHISTITKYNEVDVRVLGEIFEYLSSLEKEKKEEA